MNTLSYLQLNGRLLSDGVLKLITELEALQGDNLDKQDVIIRCCDLIDEYVSDYETDVGALFLHSASYISEYCSRCGVVGYRDAFNFVMGDRIKEGVQSNPNNLFSRNFFLMGDAEYEDNLFKTFRSGKLVHFFKLLLPYVKKFEVDVSVDRCDNVDELLRFTEKHDEVFGTYYAPYVRFAINSVDDGEYADFNLSNMINNLEMLDMGVQK